MRLNRLRRDRRAFTLIELLIVVVIIAILLAIAIPGFLAQQTKAKDQKAKQNLAYAFRDIRSNTPDTNNQFPAAQSMVSWVQQSEPQLTTSTGSCYASLTPNAVVVDSSSTSGNLTLCTKSDSGNLWKLTATPTGAPSFVDGSAVPLTVSGKEITDASRAAAVQGDGLSNDSSTGIWASATNLLPIGGFEPSAAGWTGSGPPTRSSAWAKFGSYSFLVDYTPTNNDASTVSPHVACTPGTTYSGQAWVNVLDTVTAGITAKIGWYDSSNTLLTWSSGGNVATSTGSSFLTVTATAPANTAYCALRTMMGNNVGAQRMRYYVDGAQLEQNSFSTPYIETTGTPASSQAARVRAPSALINVTQGWFVIRVRVGWPSTADPYSGSSLLAASWRDDGNNGIDLRYDPATDTWRTRRTNGSGGTQAASAVQTFSSGAAQTIAGTWSAGAIAISVDGSNFTSVAAPYTPALTSTTFDIGDREDNAAQQIDGSVLWFACGTGTLSDSDAATINGWGNTDPKVSSFPASAGADFVWDGVSSNGSLK